MDSSRFNIFEAARDAYLFVGREWPYLIKVGLLPILAQIGTSLFIQFQRPDAAVIENYLWGLPATAAFAWFVFIEVRLLLLGERIDRMPQEAAYLADRSTAMQLAVTVSLLFNMSLSGALAALLAVAEAGPAGGAGGLATFGGVVLAGAIFWGVRFSALPVLAAVGYPFRPFLQQVRGAMFSLRLIGMGLLCLFPVAFLFHLLAAVFIGRAAAAGIPPALTPAQQVGIIVGSAPVALLVVALLNAAVACALRQILGPGRSEAEA